MASRISSTRLRLFTVLCALEAGVAASPFAQQPGIDATSPVVAVGEVDAPGPGPFRTGIDLVHLHVTVTDAQGQYVTGLDRNAFAIFEDGVRHDPAFFGDGDVPIDLALLLDTSASMGPMMSQAQDAAVGFIRRLRAGDRGAIIEFNDVVRVRADFTEEVDELEAAIRSAVAVGHGGTSLYTAIYVALKTFSPSVSRAGEHRRQALVVLSDGYDTNSLVSFENVLDLTQRRGISTYTISLTSPSSQFDLPTPASQAALGAYAMRALAEATGAQTFFPQRIDELDDVYGGIVDDLSHQYTIGYTSTNTRRDGSFRRVSVRILGPSDVRALTRSGYFAP